MAISRRGLLAGTSGTAAAAALGTPRASAAAVMPASPVLPAAATVHETIVHDSRMRWRRIPTSWRDAPFLGNAFLAVQVYRGPQANVLRFMFGHSEVQDQRSQWEAGIGLSRLPIGFLTLTFAGSITAVNWTLDLWNAELTGTVTTAQGRVTLTAMVHKDRGVLLVSLTPSAGEDGVRWGFTPLPSITPRTTRRPPEYIGNPAPTSGTSGPTSYTAQPLIAGGGYATAWQEVRTGTLRRLAATVAYRFPGSIPTSVAVDRVRQALAANPDELVAAHRTWWNGYYQRSLISVPDKWVQKFYWIQLYKMAAATGAQAPVLAEWGPWFPDGGGGWTAVWWNLNVQVAYPFINGSNHLELDAVTTAFQRFEANLTRSVPPQYRDGDTYALSHPGDRTLHPGGTRTVGIPGTTSKTDQTGNLIWGLHTAWLSYRHTMNDTVLRTVIYPVLARALNFYRHFLVPGPDGRLHLPLTRSPEYADAADCTYDLSLIRWACRTLIESAQRLGIADPRIGQWRDILTRLVPYHRDTTGVMIGNGVRLAASHRHFSHLLWLYPLHEMSWDRAADRTIMRRSFDHWISMRDRWHGYSFAAASSMTAHMGSPEEAVTFLRTFLDRTIVDGTELLPNTMYREGGGFAIESPMAAAQSVLDMLVQSTGGVVKVFPAVSQTWQDASIANLRTQGAFLVDASRSGGRTDWIRVRSEAGEPLRMQHGIDGAIEVRDETGRPVPFTQVGPAEITVALPRGAAAIVTRPGAVPDLAPRNVAGNGPTPPWGLP